MGIEMDPIYEDLEELIRDKINLIERDIEKLVSILESIKR
jgi:hypothetical protein